MLNKLFGRKKIPSSLASSQWPKHPGPDRDGTSRVIPKAIFEGQHADFFRSLGVTADDPSNLMPTKESVQATADKYRQAQETLNKKIDAQLPKGVTVIPWATVPWVLWQQQHAEFLMIACELFPAQPWNSMMLPSDEYSASILKLPPHPRAHSTGHVDAATQLVGRLRGEYSAEHEKIGRAMMTGDYDALSGYADLKRKVSASVIMTGHELGKVTFGEDVWERHSQLFAGALGWPK